MESIRIRPKRGRPRKRLETVHADTMYDMPFVRFYLDGRRITSQTPSSTNRKRRRGRADRLFELESKAEPSPIHATPKSGSSDWYGSSDAVTTLHCWLASGTHITSS